MNISDLLGAMMQSGMTKPLDIQALIVAAKGRPTLAAQIYTASLLAIEVDTPPCREEISRPTGGRTGNYTRNGPADQGNGRLAGMNAKQHGAGCCEGRVGRRAALNRRNRSPGPAR
jgi:hypothetical protein